MTTLQAVFLGMMLALTPSLALLAFVLWRDGVGLRSDRDSGSRVWRPAILLWRLTAKPSRWHQRWWRQRDFGQ